MGANAKIVIDNLDPEHFMGIALALALGLLVGIQRGWSLRHQPPGSRFAGIRTFGLLGLAGGIAGALYTNAQGPALILLTAAAALVVFGYYRVSRAGGQVSGGQVSGTASMAGLLTIACGFLASSGELVLGASVAVAMVLLLSLRGKLHGWVSRLSEQEVLAIARFALIAMVILPLLPDRGFGPYHAWNPRQLWLVVVLVSGFSFVGYFAAKALGATRGLIATAAAGAVVSSTAVTAAMATRLRKGEGNPSVLVAGICVASLFMYMRVALLVGVLAGFALPSLAMLIAPAALVSFAALVWHLRSSGLTGPAPPAEAALRNPFDILPALLLAALVMLASVAAHWVLAEFGDQGLAVVLAISGSVDVDSAIITIGGLPAGALDPRMAGLVLAIPVTLNTLFKGGIAISIAGWQRGWQGALPLLASAAATSVVYALTG